MINLPKAAFRYRLSEIPKPVQEKAQQWAPTAVAIFLIAFFVIFAIKPTIVTISELLAEIKAREELNQKLSTKIDQIFTAQSLYNQIYDQLYLLDQALPDNSEFAQFSQTLEGVRLENNLNLKTLNYAAIVLTEKEKPKAAGQENQDFSFSAGLEGYYPNLKDFLKALFNQRRIIYINSLKINQEKKAKDKETTEENLPLTIAIDGKTFYLNSE